MITPLLRQDFINAYNITNRFQQDPNKVLYQISETTILPEPENLSDTESDTSEEDIHQFHILLLPVYNILNNPVPALPIVNNMAQPNQQDFQQLRAAITTLAQALPNTNNDLARNTQTINNPPHREGRVAELPYFYEGNQDPVVWLEDFTRACNANGIANGRKLKVVLAYLRGAASTWWNANQALPNNNQNRITAWTIALQELYRRVETNAFIYPEAIKAWKFVNGLLPDLYITVKPYNDQTWNGTTSGQTLQSSNRPNQYICYASGKPRHVRKCTRQMTISSNLTLLEAYPATRTTRSKARLDPTAGIVRDKPTEEETILRTVQGLSKVKQPTKTTETKKVGPKKIIKKKPAVVAPIYKMVEPYTLQQFFDQKAYITNGQLLVMNPKFGLTIAKQLRKLVVRTKDNEKNSIKKNDEMPDDKNTPEVDDLIQVANTARPNADQTSALYYEASIKHIKFLLIVDSGSAGSIISLSLLRDLDMKITKASKTVMSEMIGSVKPKPFWTTTKLNDHRMERSSFRGHYQM
ncbi:hypothetical protein GLOIN_2v1448689 [Rhizophagus clarus]|uniref:Retrotransposon gag domain-containing protein n=1 Tax=Rhizophagus clarus TaxID=94130 RepID=A0A8H3QV39_9GLOM|nr:hypothetical protein GLOIN_2v1448689 [Rhizophagus clarus]